MTKTQKGTFFWGCLCLITFGVAAIWLNWPKTTKVQTYPQFVHSACIDKWAIKMGEKLEANSCPLEIEVYYKAPCWDKKHCVKEYLGIHTGGFEIGTGGEVFLTYNKVDTAIVNEGAELQFADSLSAVSFYGEYIKNIRARQVADSTKEAARKERGRIADSIFKCQHQSYK